VIVPDSHQGADIPTQSGDICPIHGVPFTLNKWNKWTHPTDEKNDKGKTIWCYKDKVSTPTNDTPTPDKNAVGASPVANNRDFTDWSKVTQREFLDRVVEVSRGKGMLPDDVKDFLINIIHVPDSRSITIAMRNEVIQKLTGLVFEPK